MFTEKKNGPSLIEITFLFVLLKEKNLNYTLGNRVAIVLKSLVLIYNVLHTSN